MPFVQDRTNKYAQIPNTPRLGLRETPWWIRRRCWWLMTWIWAAFPNICLWLSQPGSGFASSVCPVADTCQMLSSRTGVWHTWIWGRTTWEMRGWGFCVGPWVIRTAACRTWSKFHTSFSFSVWQEHSVSGPAKAWATSGICLLGVDMILGIEEL